MGRGLNACLYGTAQHAHADRDQSPAHRPASPADLRRLADRHPRGPFRPRRSHAVIPGAGGGVARIARHGGHRLRATHRRGVPRYPARLRHLRLPRSSRHRDAGGPCLQRRARRGHTGPSVRIRGAAGGRLITVARHPPHPQPLDRRPHVRPVSVRRVEAPGAAAPADTRPEPLSVRSARRRTPGAARDHRRLSQSIARGALRPRSRDHRQRVAAGPRPVCPRAGRSGRRRGRRGPGLPRRARAVHGQRRPRAPGRRG